MKCSFLNINNKLSRFKLTEKAFFVIERIKISGKSNIKSRLLRVHNILSISYLPAAKTTSTNLDMPWNILENITSLFKCLAIFIVLISMLHVYGNLYSHVHVTSLILLLDECVNCNLYVHLNVNTQLTCSTWPSAIVPYNEA